MQTESHDSHDNTVWMPLKDTYGRDMGEIVGVIYNLQGGIESIGVRESGGRFVVYSGKSLARRKSELVVIPEWRTEAQTLAREIESLNRRERAIEELARVNDANAKVLEEVTAQIAATRASHERLRMMIDARLNEVEALCQSISDFVGTAKVQHASTEIDQGAYLVTAEFGRVELEAHARELDELRRAVGFLENIEQQEPLPSTAGLSQIKAVLPAVELYPFQEPALSMVASSE